jgi:hypothetical protein
MFSSVAVAVTPSSIFSSDAVAVTPSNMFSSAAVDVIAVPPNVSDPDTSKLPFKSTVVAASCISVSATRSSCPSVLEFM